jgi:twitching motility protein PilT
MIREKATEQLRTAIQTGTQYGMRTMDKSLKELYEKQLITYETAIGAARNIEELKSLLGKR